MSESSDRSTLHIGAAWHPELYTQEQWASDIELMKELGIDCVRIFEYAWGRFEPAEWQYEFGWATGLLDKLREAGIGAILCTPTSVPPPWMNSRFPEIQRTRPDGRRWTPGRPGSASPVSQKYRELCSRIVDQMVHAFRGHDAIVGWQIDSRMYGADYGSESRRAFHTWLGERFGTVDSLNTKWGTAWLGQTFEYFDQVPLPTQIAASGVAQPELRPLPSLAMAFQRFANDQWSAFIQPQVEQVRGAFEGKPISAVMSGDWSMNWFRLNHLVDNACMSLAKYDGTPDGLLMHLDRLRGEKSGTAFWLVDVVANWLADAGIRAVRSGAQVLSHLWLGAMMGAQTMLMRNWRGNPAGQDMLDGALLTATGKPAPNFEAIKGISRIREQMTWLAEHPPVEARVAVMVSNESAWAFAADPPEDGFDYESVWRREYYAPLLESHYWRDVIDQTQDFCPYQVIVATMLPIRHRQTVDRLKEWVNSGGHLLVGPMTATRNEECSAFTDTELGGLEELIGATSASRFPAREDVTVSWESTHAQEGSAVPDSLARGWCEGFAATTASILGRYRGGWGDGQGAILMHKIGQGAVITVGCRVDRATYLDLVGALCDMAKVQSIAQGDGEVSVVPRMNPDSSIAGYGLVNLSGQSRTVTLPQAGTDRLSGNTVGPEIKLEPHQVMLVEVAAQDKAG